MPDIKWALCKNQLLLCKSSKGELVRQNFLNRLCERLSDLEFISLEGFNPFTTRISSNSFCHLLLYGSKEGNGSQTWKKWLLLLRCLSFITLGSAQGRNQVVGLELIFPFSYGPLLAQWNRPMFPSEDELCAADQTELYLPGDWQQLCHCWATNQRKPLGLWNLGTIWIMRALSQKRLCLFLQTWTIKWLGLSKQLPRSLLYWAFPLTEENS